MQPSISAKVVTVDGQTVEVPLNSVAVPVTDDVVTINTLQFSPWVVPDKPKQITFSSIIKFKEGAVPTHITIADVTEDPILEFIDEPSPKIVKDGLIGIISKPSTTRSGWRARLLAGRCSGWSCWSPGHVVLAHISGRLLRKISSRSRRGTVKMAGYDLEEGADHLPDEGAGRVAGPAPRRPSWGGPPGLMPANAFASDLDACGVPRP